MGATVGGLPEFVRARFRGVMMPGWFVLEEVVEKREMVNVTGEFGFFLVGWDCM